MIHHASVSSHHVDDDDDDTSWETDDQIIERIPGALRPPPYSALNRSWLRGGGKSCAWAEVSVSIQYNSIQFIKLFKLFWHLPLTIFAASPYQPPSHIYILKRADQNRFVKTKKIGRDIAVLPSCPMRAPLMNWFQLSFLTAWFSGSFRSDLRPFSIVFYGC